MKRFITIIISIIIPLLSFGQSKYDPEVFALESGRGELASEYFGVRLSDLKKTATGRTVSLRSREIRSRHISLEDICAPCSGYRGRISGA